MPAPQAQAADPASPAPNPGSADMHPMARDMLERMLQAGRAEPDPARRRAVLDGAARGTPRAFCGLILNAIAAPAPGSLEHEVARAIFLRWAWETPDFAAAWAVAAPPGPFRREALAEAAGRWASRNTDAAVKWARALPAGDRRWVFENAGHLVDPASPSSIEAWKRAAESER